MCTCSSCGAGLVITGITGVVPPLSATSGQSSIQLSVLCGNPDWPTALAQRDVAQVPACRAAWSIPRDEAAANFTVANISMTSMEACARACGVMSARRGSAYAPPLLAVLYTVRALAVANMKRTWLHDSRNDTIVF